MFPLPHRKRVDFENLPTCQANKISTYLGLFDQNKKSKILIHPPFHWVACSYIIKVHATVPLITVVEKDRMKSDRNTEVQVVIERI
jgi:hypothetical protein